MIPPIRFAQERLQIVGGAADDHYRRCDQRPDQQRYPDETAQHTDPLQQVGVGNFDRFCRPNTKNYRYPGKRGSFLKEGKY